MKPSVPAAALSVLCQLLLLCLPASAAPAELGLPRAERALEQKFDIVKYKAFKALDRVFDPSTGRELSDPERFQDYEDALEGYGRTAEAQMRRAMGAWLKTWLPGLYSSFVALNTDIQRQLAAHQRAVRSLAEESFKVDPVAIARTMRFLRSNVSDSGMPLSYDVPEGYWQAYRPMMDSVDTVLERILVEYTLSIYDGALWQIALESRGGPEDKKAARGHTQKLRSGRLGELNDIRAYGPMFRYGENKAQVKKANGFFFRIISDRYFQPDPVLGDVEVPGFPNFVKPHHEDWKPITGEQAWGAIIGPLQSAYFRYRPEDIFFSDEVKLALSILPTIELMQSGIGAIYHVPFGTKNKSPHDISNENNFSMYAALRMLHGVIEDRDARKAARIKKILAGQEAYFKEYAFDRGRGIFYQGGLYIDGSFRPTRIFASDCQTWAILSLGPAWIDQAFGEGTAFRVWQETKRRAGHFDRQGIFRGIGFTDGQRMLSIEWTAGAILAARELAKFYEGTHPERAAQLHEDIVCMRNGIEAYTIVYSDGSKAYLYANKRYFIPFGWWANPLPSLASSAWVILVDTGFDPFVLGGGEDYRRPERVSRFYSPVVPTPSRGVVIERDTPQEESFRFLEPQEVFSPAAETGVPSRSFKNLLSWLLMLLGGAVGARLHSLLSKRKRRF